MVGGLSEADGGAGLRMSARGVSSCGVLWAWPGIEKALWGVQQRRGNLVTLTFG